MSAGYYTSAGSPSDRREDISLANRVHPPEGSMSRGHGIMSAGYYTSAGSPSDEGGHFPGEPCASAGGCMSGRHDIMISNASHVHVPEKACPKDMA